MSELYYTEGLYYYQDTLSLTRLLARDADARRRRARAGSAGPVLRSGPRVISTLSSASDHRDLTQSHPCRPSISNTDVYERILSVYGIASDSAASGLTRVESGETTLHTQWGLLWIGS